MLSGVLLLATVAWFTASWIDIGDSTCGAVVYPDMWLDGTPQGCRGVMALRAGIALALATAGVVVSWIGIRGRRANGGAAGALFTATVLVGAAVLWINEAVRSDGAL